MICRLERKRKKKYRQELPHYPPPHFQHTNQTCIVLYIWNIFCLFVMNMLFFFSLRMRNPLPTPTYSNHIHVIKEHLTLASFARYCIFILSIFHYVHFDLHKTKCLHIHIHQEMPTVHIHIYQEMPAYMYIFIRMWFGPISKKNFQ